MTQDQEEKLNDLHDAIVGNMRMGNKGLVVRLQETEDYIEKDKKFKNKVIGAVAVGTPVAAGIWHIIWKKITGE